MQWIIKFEYFLLLFTCELEYNKLNIKMECKIKN